MNQDKTNAAPTAIRFLLRIARPRIGLIGAAFAMAVGASLAAVAAQYSMKLLIDALSAPGRLVGPASLALGLFLGLMALENVLWRSGGWLGARAAIRFGADLRVTLFDHLTAQSWRFFHRHMQGALVNRFSACSTAGSALLCNLIWSVLPPVADFAGSVGVLATVDWRLAAILVAAAAFIVAMLAWLGRRGDARHQAAHAQAAAVLGNLAEILANIALVKAFNATRRERARLLDGLANEMLAQKTSWMHLEGMRALHDLVFWAASALVLAVSVHRWSEGLMTAGDVLVASTLSLRVLNGSRDLALSLLGLGQQLGAIGEAISVLMVPHDLPDRPDAVALHVSCGKIEFCGVRYAPEAGRLLFDGLDLVVPAGQRLGLVGPSGGGKTTLLRLLQRQDALLSGTILVDGQDIAGATAESLAASLAVVTQDVHLFQRTILENIRYGRPEADDAAVMRAARLACCADLAGARTEGFRALIGEHGILLSGGQRQRLAIARASLKDAPILLLDEATSALDTLSESQVQAGLDDWSRGRTVVAVAHRVSTIMNFDRVVVLANGRIVEDGTPASLLAAGGIFAAMCRPRAAAA